MTGVSASKISAYALPGEVLDDFSFLVSELRI
jgi:hypothetical protein